MDRLIELNADIGEGGPDAALMALVDRVSIACGGHTGDESSMTQALLLARDLGAMAGAHPSYPDQNNFGREVMEAEPAEITRWVVEQTLALKQAADTLGMKLFHVKPHGALYNRAAVDEETARALVAAMQELGGLALVALAGSPLVALAKAAGLEVLEEAFADRRYSSDGRLAHRKLPGAVIEHPEEAAQQAEAIARGQSVVTLEGSALVIQAQTICLHGDEPGAIERAKAIAFALRGK